MRGSNPSGKGAGEPHRPRPVEWPDVRPHQRLPPDVLEAHRLPARERVLGWHGNDPGFVHEGDRLQARELPGSPSASARPPARDDASSVGNLGGVGHPVSQATWTASFSLLGLLGERHDEVAAEGGGGAGGVPMRSWPSTGL